MSVCERQIHLWILEAEIPGNLHNHYIFDLSYFTVIAYLRRAKKTSNFKFTDSPKHNQMFMDKRILMGGGLLIHQMTKQGSRYVTLVSASLLLAAMPCDHCLFFQSCSSQQPCCLAFSMSGIPLKLNGNQLPAVYHFGQSRRGNRLTGLTLLTAWFFPLRKWHLRTCTNITMKVAMWRVAS